MKMALTSGSFIAASALDLLVLALLGIRLRELTTAFLAIGETSVRPSPTVLALLANDTRVSKETVSSYGPI